ncbi:D123-domain-containing protein [Catenaria anguillulae PL171]|uniref:D123-domain-containing protein n=1 Tax=Catenaria anguillulae PL171 TaxID=765915 RepID=A0A1Y2HP96_9FUNG|nr:D123-domain-containing protein [Catenaria anguillulae PL171]
MAPTATPSPVSEPASLAPFSFEQWYPLFRRHTIKSVVIDLPTDFVEYLHADGIALPESEALYTYDESVDTEAIASQSDSDSGDDDDDDIASEAEPAPTFPALESAISAAIASLGGAVFPKLNWSSPRDAAWIALDGTLKCGSMSDIILLLKASDFVAHDLDQPAERRVLVLRKWAGLHPGLEFRCWVHAQQLIAISQRDTSHFYPFLVTDHQDLSDSIHDFFEDVVRDQFPLESYCFDVYLAKADREPTLVDLNPFSQTTDTLLYTWDELQQLALAAASKPAVAMPAPTTALGLGTSDNVQELSNGITRIYLNGNTDAHANSNANANATAGNARADLRAALAAAIAAAEAADDDEQDAELRVIRSELEVHSGAAPTFAASRVPLDVVAISQGKSVAEFAAEWQVAMAQAAAASDDENE